MRHMAKPLRRLLSEQPEPEPTPQDEENFYQWAREVEPDPTLVGIFDELEEE